jgi:NADH-quinone oxidoreductase subunit H
MQLDFFIAKAILVVVVFAVSLGIAAYSTWAERKVAAFFQDRLGPNRAGVWGLLQPLADGGKMFFKEDFLPANANKWLFIAGPSLAMFTALLSSAVIPWGQSLKIGAMELTLSAIDVNIGVLWIFGVVSLGVYGIMIGGWASNNKYSLLGAIRAASQNISYELAMGLSIIAILMMTGGLSVREIVERQHGFNWNVFYQPLGFIIFLVCAFAECNRTPFDLPECETELIGGYHTEYSAMKLGFYLFAEYINMFISSAVISALYFGGYNYPGMDWVAEKLGSDALGHNIATIIGVLVFLGKTVFFIFFYMWVRWTLPRFRYDQLMHLGWQGLIPVAIFNVIATGFAILFGNDGSMTILISWASLAILIGIGLVREGMRPKKKKLSVI